MTIRYTVLCAMLVVSALVLGTACSGGSGTAVSLQVSSAPKKGMTVKLGQPVTIDGVTVTFGPIELTTVTGYRYLRVHVASTGNGDNPDVAFSCKGGSGNYGAYLGTSTDPQPWYPNDPAPETGTVLFSLPDAGCHSLGWLDVQGANGSSARVMLGTIAG